MIKKLSIILGFITAILAVILAVTPFYSLAIAPTIVAFICGIIILFVSKKEHFKTKPLQYIFIMVIIALVLTIYKNVNATSEIGDINQLEQRDKDNLEDSKELLEDIDLDEDL